MQIASTESPTGPRPPATVEALRDASKQLEAAFLAIMLKEGGIGTARDSMGGGIGEEQFASFLTEIHARQMVDAGGIGLAESIFRALSRGTHD